MTEATEKTAKRTSSAAQAGDESAPQFPANGLALERIYTSPGVHPYAEVTWERRDVVMTNWRDG
ncbi:MAG: hypothetical protein ABI301_06170, partial [Jatrophihabitantaceae bacterium]